MDCSGGCTGACRPPIRMDADHLRGHFGTSVRYESDDGDGRFGENGLRWDMGNEDDFRSFFSAPTSKPIKQRDPDATWTAPLPMGYAVENDPLMRRIVRDGRVLAEYPVGDNVQERMVLLQLLQQGTFNASSLSRAWGLHRNTLGNWSWRYRYFGLDGLVDGRLPARRIVLEEVLREAERGLREQPRLSATRLGVLLYKRRRVNLPLPTLHWLRSVVFGPRPLALQLRFPVGSDDAADGTAQPETEELEPLPSAEDKSQSEHQEVCGLQPHTLP